MNRIINTIKKTDISFRNYIINTYNSNDFKIELNKYINTDVNTRAFSAGNISHAIRTKKYRKLNKKKSKKIIKKNNKTKCNKKLKRLRTKCNR
jgi:hypothetical protein